MNRQRQRYPEDHWIRSQDPEQALDAYLDQQSKAYSRAKNEHIRDLLGDLQGKRFLDYGCGAGYFSVHAALSGAAQVVGVDAEETVLSTARYFARQENVDKLCHFSPSDRFPSFPPHARFDVILMKDVIEHVEDDQGLLEDAASVIEPGGTIVISTQNAMSINYLLEGTYQRAIRKNHRWFGWDDTHLRFYTPPALASKLRRAGFRPVRWRSAYLIPYRLPRLPGSGKKFTRIDALSWIDKTLGRVFPYNHLGWSIIVKAVARPEVPARIRVMTPANREFAPEAAWAPPAVILPRT
ncbi:MAG: methyltransferase domain-containing protein [Thermodesulfobacteriota bacterium]